MITSGLIIETAIKKQVSPNETDHLLAEGWRHFGAEFFRYNYNFHEEKLARVLPLRINLKQFAHSKSQRKILHKNQDTTVIIQPLEIDTAKINLFEQHKYKFKDNLPGNIFEIISAQDPSGIPCHTMEVSVYSQTKLIACSFMDVGTEATSSIYGFYDLNESVRSLGIFTMLLEIEWSVANGKLYYYPGYAYDIPSYYDYKKRFAALEFYNWKGNWLKFTENIEYDF
jgi:arginine-tRNA-protein transferase